MSDVYIDVEHGRFDKEHGIKVEIGKYGFVIGVWKLQ